MNSWTPLRLEIKKIIIKYNIAVGDFSEVHINEWLDIERKLYNVFTNLNYPKEKTSWLWQFYNQDTHSIAFESNNIFEALSALIGDNQRVWLILSESVKERTKFWYYECDIKTTTLVLSESTQIKEVYIASKKYDWLLCINHHNILIATGTYMVTKLKELETRL